MPDTARHPKPQPATATNKDSSNNYSLPPVRFPFYRVLILTFALIIPVAVDNWPGYVVAIPYVLGWLYVIVKKLLRRMKRKS